MGVSFIHTADWQIGKVFGRFAEEPRVLLGRQRIDTVRRIGHLARSRNADAVLVAGDVFDTGAVSDDTIRRTLNALDGFPGPWVFLPGNHDAALAESPWTRIERIGRPDNVILAIRAEPIGLPGCALTILPAPLVRRHEAVDLTEWFDAAITDANTLRVGLAHGSIQAFLPAAADAPNPIAHDRAERARLDYLALGDWHGTLQVAPRTWYSGTPEPDRFRANDQGNVLLVSLDAPGTEARVERIEVGHYRWHQCHAALHRADDVAQISRVLDGLGEPLDARVVDLMLEGTVDLDTRMAAAEALDTWRARLHSLEVDDSHLVAEPSADDLDRIDRLGFVRTAIESLRDRARNPADSAGNTARLALQILYTEHLKRDR